MISVIVLDWPGLGLGFDPVSLLSPACGLTITPAYAQNPRRPSPFRRSASNPAPRAGCAIPGSALPQACRESGNWGSDERARVAHHLLPFHVDLSKPYP